MDMSDSSVLTVASRVVCRVDRVYPHKAEVTIIGNDATGEVLRHPMKAQLKLQDVRSFDIDKALMTDHVYPGDIVRAHMLSVGDMKSCFVSTIGQEFGVIVAKDPKGNELFPLDQSHMKNKDGQVFKRKVARPEWMNND
jgi:exosome complex component CSL4